MAWAASRTLAAATGGSQKRRLWSDSVTAAARARLPVLPAPIGDPTHQKHVLQPLPSPLIFRLADLYFDNHTADVKFKTRAKIDGLKLEY